MPQLADDKSAKYYNSKETRLFSKSKQLYGFDLALPSIRKQQNVLVMEGYTDVIMASQFGVQNVTAVLGTALTAEHIRFLSRMDVPEVVLVLDGDDAGQRRANEVVELFVAAQFELRIATIPEAQDPCDFLLNHGTEAFHQLVGEAEDALQHKLRVATKEIDVARQPQKANHALEEVLATLAKAPKPSESTSRQWRIREEQILKSVAHRFAIDEMQIRERLKELRTKSTSGSSFNSMGGDANHSAAEFGSAPFTSRHDSRRDDLNRNGPNRDQRSGGNGRGKAGKGKGHNARNRQGKQGWQKKTPAFRSLPPVPPMMIGDNVLDPMEQELLQLLVTQPELMMEPEVALEVNWIRNPVVADTVQLLLKLVEANNEAPTFAQIVDVLEQKEARFLVVHLADEAEKKEPLAQEEPPIRYAELTQRLRRRAAIPHIKSRVAQLHDASDEEELAILGDLLERKRDQQGIDPKEG